MLDTWLLVCLACSALGTDLFAMRKSQKGPLRGPHKLATKEGAALSTACQRSTTEACVKKAHDRCLACDDAPKGSKYHHSPYIEPKIRIQQPLSGPDTLRRYLEPTGLLYTLTRSTLFDSDPACPPLDSWA